MDNLSNIDSAELENKIKEAKKIIDSIDVAISFKIVGQENLKKRLIQALSCNGHILLEGVPGIAKTLSIKTLAESINAGFKRIQFTPDLLPADIIGTEIYLPKTGEFSVRLGPVFTNFLLADEINRAPAKVQSALLETMQERQVTIGETSHTLPRPFFVLATQNPIEQEGTYPLPEAQVDRFLIKVKVSHPNATEEKEVLNVIASGQVNKDTPVVASLEDVNTLTATRELVFVDEKVKEYIVEIVGATRDFKSYSPKMRNYIEYGASPRASVALYRMAQAHAMYEGLSYVLPDHVKAVAYDVLRHRIGLSYEAEANGVTSENIIEVLLNSVKVP